MDGYTTDYINLIADNLRDRYENGFPILKELIQNADDAKARNFIFAYHEGFPDAGHSLLTGPGLWFFNDGEFKPTDARALRSFGINSKAGDASAIGKFGLGMKSVFHLCEALFYLAWDGQELHRKGLNPWKQDDRDAHPEWDKDDSEDWNLLEALATPLMGQSATWFLLWIPLRCKTHLRNARGEDIGAIIDYCPGDNPHQSLNFLSQSSLPLDLAQILTLLKHLERIEHQGKLNLFTIQLKADQRLLGDGVAERSSGEVVLRLVDSEQSLRFAGMGHQDHDRDKLFSSLKDRREWPKSRYRDERGHEKPVPDKARPEAAVLFCSGPTSRTRFDLHWAVFLPVDQGSERLRFETGKPGHSLVLHGQFFIDAGRKKPHALENLHDIPASISTESIDDAVLRRTWNQHLAQRVLLPLVIPALEHYVAAIHLSDADSKALTQALADSHWFDRFKSHVCCSDSWFRIMEPGAEPVWKRVNGLDLDRLRPLPSPPKSDAQRPWQIFPRLKRLGLLTYDANAPFLYKSKLGLQWQEAELDDLLGEVAGLFTDGPRMDYLFDFLESYAKPFLQTERLQLRLISLFRAGLLAAGGEARRQHAEKSRRLFEFVEPSRRLALAVDLPDSILQAIWKVEATLLLLPKLEPALIGYANPDDNTLRDWLQVLDHQLDKKLSESNQQAILDASQGLLKGLDGERRGRFLRIHDNLRIIAVRDVRTGKYRAVTGAEIRAVRAAGTLFRFTQGTQERERMGLTPLLTAALPDSRIWLVRAESYRDLFPNEDNPPPANDKQALLVAIGCDESGGLGDIRARCALLEQANDPGRDAVARRGLRYLLHGSKEHRKSDNARLWFPGHDQHPAWSKLWSQIHGADGWSLISNELANTVPRVRWEAIDVYEIKARSLTDELARTGADIPMPGDFALAEREEILSKIENQYLWQRLPLHTTVAGQQVSTDNARVYLAPADETLHDPLVQEATLIAPSANSIVAAQQRRWLRPLDDRARIEIALGTEKPAQYWLTIMNALVLLSANIRWELTPRLRSSAWLPTGYGRPVKPEQVIDLAGSLADLVQRVVAEYRQACEDNFAVLSDFDERLRNHTAWDKVRKELFSSGEAGLIQLGQMLTQLPKYHIGTWQANPSAEIINLLAQCQLLPGWQLLQGASLEFPDRETVWYRLGPGRLAQPLTSDALFAVLRWITNDTADWSTRKVICDGYLQQYVDANSGESVNLKGLRLANCRSQWRDVAELCKVTDGANIGIDPSCILDSFQASLLVKSVSLNKQKTNQRIDPDQEGIDTGFDDLYKDTPWILERYFAPWQQFVPSPMIGLLLMLLGGRHLSSEEEPLYKLTSRYLEPYSFDWVIEKLDKGGDYDTIGEQIGKRRLAVQTINTNSVKILNLFGDPMTVQLDQHPQTLIAGQLNKMRGIGVGIPLRDINPAGLQDQQRINLLFGTAESLCAEIYPPRGNLDHLRVQLDHTNQLEIQTAYRLILHDIPLYLRQLSIHHDGISKKLQDHRRALSELELDNNRYNQIKLEDSREALTQLIVEDNPAQQAVLNAVKAKLNDYQYDLSSIPFELFQNADDAAVELGEMLAVSTEDCSIPEGARRLIVESNQTGIRILHWGRPINARGPVSFDGAGRGFDQDLEKMLLLSASDKQANKGVTGKFGLGFKSVLLACNKPRILSGNLAVEIVAGILPTLWRDDAEAQNCLEQYASDGRLRGTLIELSDISQQQRATILERFQRLASIICVFGRAIRSISMIGDVEKRFDWKAKQIATEIELGSIFSAYSGNALCIRTQNGSVLLAIGPEGIRPLSDEVPTLWVTAPTREQAKVGFAINGGFILDAGRGELATRADSGQKNHKLARQIGIQAGEAIGKLFEQSLTDWPTLRQDLNILADLDVHDFWLSLWRCLTEDWLGRIRHAAAELAREVAVALLKRLGEKLKAIPNDLATPYRALVSAHEVRFELAKAFAVPEVIAVLGTWDRFVAKYPPNTLVSEDMGAVLKHIELAQPNLLGLVVLVAVLDPPKVEPSDAGSLGRLLILTEEDKGWNAKEVRERLVRLQFRTEEGGWAVAGSLLANAGELIDQDEVLRYAFAPQNRRLHRDYSVTANQDTNPTIDFFRVCRGSLQADVKDLTKWVLDAQTDEIRLATLVYIADGKLGEGVADQVRDRDWLRGIFPNSSLLSRLSGEQRDRLQRRLASSKVIEEGYKAVEPDYWSPQPLPPLIDLGKALANIHDWWVCEGKVQAENYYAAFYPAMEIDLQIDPETRGFDRSSWLILFSLGAFQNIGRTQDAQHRGFVQYCQQKGWWQTFATTDPKEHPDEWMDIIEEYAEGQHDDEQWTLWIAQFPKLYKLRRWMDDYVELFLSIDRFDKQFQLESVLMPKANPYYQGGGIGSPPLNRTLNLGSHLVIRELLRHRVIRSPFAIHHAYAPIDRIQRLFYQFNMPIDSSQKIYELLCKHLGEAQATFNGYYDIPLRIVAGDQELQNSLFR